MAFAHFSMLKVRRQSDGDKKNMEAATVSMAGGGSWTGAWEGGGGDVGGGVTKMNNAR